MKNKILATMLLLFSFLSFQKSYCAVIPQSVFREIALTILKSTPFDIIEKSGSFIIFNGADDFVQIFIKENLTKLLKFPLFTNFLEKKGITIPFILIGTCEDFLTLITKNPTIFKGIPKDILHSFKANEMARYATEVIFNGKSSKSAFIFLERETLESSFSLPFTTLGEMMKYSSENLKNLISIMLRLNP